MSLLLNTPGSWGLDELEVNEEHGHLQLQSQEPALAPDQPEQPTSPAPKVSDPPPTVTKPSFHLTAPKGWINDPCGLVYDPTTTHYHLFFQWNPHGNDWGNISWGQATSTDLVTWKVSPSPALTPATDYDRCGIFTGCVQATDLHGNPGALTALYTSVRHLPLHYTLPYITGSESLSAAVSNDAGESWVRHGSNPILAGSPENVAVTGWRDPHLTRWSWSGDDDDQRSLRQQQLHGVISGGIVDKAPAIFVYAVNPTDLCEWNYLGPLVDVGLNFYPSRWSGDFGVNWEVGNLTMLTNEWGDCRDFAIMGAEGCLRGESTLWAIPGSARYKRQARSQLWMCVQPKYQRRQAGNPAEREKEGETEKHEDNDHGGDNVDSLAEYVFAGYFDHGCLYAANSFWDPISSQRIVYGWITEEDLPDELRHEQGWSGVISLPRVIQLMTICNVTKARSSKLESITSIEAIPDIPKNRSSKTHLQQQQEEIKTYTIHTLGIKPDPRLGLLRNGAKIRHFPSSYLPIPLRTSSNETLELKTACWELEVEFLVGQSCKRVGVQIAHAPDSLTETSKLTTTPNTTTTLSWTPSTETFTIHRPTPTLQKLSINHGYESAPHTLFTSFTNSVGDKGEKENEREVEEREEPLRIHAFFDKSVLEVFVNGRTVISTRVYYPSNRCFGVRFFAEEQQQQQQQNEDKNKNKNREKEEKQKFDERRSESCDRFVDEPPAILVKAEVWDGLGIL